MSMGGYGTAIKTYGNKILRWIFRNRFILSVILFLGLVMLRISGSSVGYWYAVLGEGKSGILAGTARGVRSDEWGMLTPLCFGQQYNSLGAYARYSVSPNGVLTDNLIVYGQPAWNILTLFRPFYWGYLLFGSSMGLSWFWCGRMIALVLSFFELGLLITDKSKKLSVLLSVCVAWAPFLQWWFAVNGLAEMLIYGACMVLGAHYLVAVPYNRKKYAAALMMTVCAIGYVLTFYPAWMAPLAWSFVPVFLWVVVKKRENGCLSKRDILPWLFMLSVSAAALVYLFVVSADTIQAVMESEYPGAGNESVGGGGLLWMLKYPFSLLSWAYNSSNMVENSSVICFAPVGIVTAVWVMLRERKRDFLLIGLLAVDLLLTWYYCVGVPKWVSKVFLMCYTNGNRGPQVIGFLRLFILVRALALKKRAIGKWFCACAAVLSAVLAIGMAWCFTRFAAEEIRYGYLDGVWKPACIFLIFAFAFYLLYRADRRRCTGAAVFACAVVLASSLGINPIQRGAPAITESPTVEEIKKLVREDPQGIWAVIDSHYPATNIPYMAGACCINTSQTYPQKERWCVLDPDGTNTEVYNRYCHIEAYLGEETAFKLLSADSIAVTMDEEDLKNMRIKYILCPYRDLNEKYSGWEGEFEEIYKGNRYSIYRIAM